MTAGGDSPAKRLLLDWKTLAGILLSIALLYYAFRGVHFGEVVERIREANVWLLVLASAAATAVFPLRALRWGPLLRPVHPGSRVHARFAATCIGFMANNLLPARVGEFARAYALTRLEGVRVSASFGSLVVERMFDGILVVSLLLISMVWPGFPDVSERGFDRAALGIAVLFLLLFALLLYLVHRPEQAVRLFQRTGARLLPRSVRRPVVDAMRAFLAGVAAIRDWRLVVQALAWSVGVWGIGAVGFWLGFMAFGIDVPFIGAVFLQSVISLAVSLPSAPGFFGLFEAGARIGLVQVWGVESAAAMAFALGFHLAGFIPVTLLGLFYVWRLGLTWQEVEASEEVVESEVEAETADTEELDPAADAR